MIEAIKEPNFFYREYSNDIDVRNKTATAFDHIKKVSLVALPFFGLYKPLSYPLALVTGALRTYTTATQLTISISRGEVREIAFSFFQTAIAVICVASTFFAHPLGMLITTASDFTLELMRFATHLQHGNHKEAAESALKIASHSLYMALILQGGLGLTIGFLVSQVLIGLSSSARDFQKGDYLEASGHLLMSLIRTAQAAQQINTLQKIRQIEQAKDSAIASPSKKLVAHSITALASKNKTDNKETWEKVAAYAKEHLPLEGTLQAKQNGFTYVKVDDDYIHTLFSMLELSDSGFKKPPYFRSKEAPGAHISVFYDNEHIVAKELGQTFHFDIKEIVLVHPAKGTTYAVLQVESPELEHLRQSYGLKPKLHGHEYHISLAKQQLKV